MFLLTELNGVEQCGEQLQTRLVLFVRVVRFNCLENGRGAGREINWHADVRKVGDQSAQRSYAARIDETHRAHINDYALGQLGILVRRQAPLRQL